jgi:hypothetical protein
MAQTSEQVYQSSLGLERGRVNQVYGRNLEILARKMRDATEQMQANMEGRGVLRSGETDLARTRLKEEEAFQKKQLAQDKAYDLQKLALDEQARAAARAAAAAGGGSSSVMPSSSQMSPDQYLNALLNASGFRVNPVPVMSQQQRTQVTPSGMGARPTSTSTAPARTVSTTRFRL